MFQNSQDREYLDVIVNRVKNEYLTWCEQFLDILAENLNLKSRKTLNDIGCNVGQFYKSLKRRNLNIEYKGYDIEPEYISIEKSFFPELNECIYLMDITKNKPLQADISVVSATIEHFEFISPGLNHILETTNEIFLLRTFLGDYSDKSICKKERAETYYYIHQYSFREVLELFEKYKFKTTVVRDRYMDSMPKYLGNGIVRTQYIVIGKK